MVLFILGPLLPFAQSVITSQSSPPLVDKMPGYPGGMKALAKLFIDSVDLPSVKWQERDEKDDHPEITLALVINEQGTVVDVKVLKSINPKTDARCISLAHKLKFTPALYNSKPVKVTYKLPIKFDMEFY